MKEQEKNNLKRLLWLGNVHSFFPDRSAMDLQQGYNQWLDHKQAFQKLYVKMDLARLTEDLDGAPHVDLKEGIMLTFHYGPYRLVPRYLLAMGYKVTLLVSADVLLREETAYRQELGIMGLSNDYFECLDAQNPMVLRKLCQAVEAKRMVVVFLDAHETLANNADKDREAKLRIAFGAHYFYWRTNMLILAQRLGMSVSVAHMEVRQHGERQSWQMRTPQIVLSTTEKNRQDALLKAFEVLQQTFQAMIAGDWTAWENWTLLHRYTVVKKQNRAAGINSTGSWLMPFTLGHKAYLFDIATKGFFEVVCKNK
nr:hypothetical protein [uncultured Sphingobacterium sp.]